MLQVIVPFNSKDFASENFLRKTFIFHNNSLFYLTGVSYSRTMATNYVIFLVDLFRSNEMLTHFKGTVCTKLFNLFVSLYLC